MLHHHDTGHEGTVTHDVALHCDDQRGRPMAFMATCQYSPDDPYAVWLTFHVPAGDVPWALSRSLLARGLTRPAGEGDVRVRPVLGDDRRAMVEMTFRTDEGRLRVQVRAADLLRFLTRTWALVAPGEETVDLDGLVAALLA